MNERKIQQLVWDGEQDHVARIGQVWTINGRLYGPLGSHEGTYDGPSRCFNAIYEPDPAKGGEDVKPVYDADFWRELCVSQSADSTKKFIALQDRQENFRKDFAERVKFLETMYDQRVKGGGDFDQMIALCNKELLDRISALESRGAAESRITVVDPTSPEGLEVLASPAFAKAVEQAAAKPECKHDQGAYYSSEHNNFYCRSCKRGMGNEFYAQMVRFKNDPKYKEFLYPLPPPAPAEPRSYGQRVAEKMVRSGGHTNEIIMNAHDNSKGGVFVDITDELRPRQDQIVADIQCLIAHALDSARASLPKPQAVDVAELAQILAQSDYDMPWDERTKANRAQYVNNATAALAFLGLTAERGEGR